MIRPQRLRKAIAAETADRLMLLTKWRGDAVISDDKTSVGSGKPSGLGLYRYARREGLSQGQTDVHVLSAPFVYTRLSLIDLAASKVIRSKSVQDARPYPATATTEQQIAGMLELLTASTEAAVATVSARDGLLRRSMSGFGSALRRSPAVVFRLQLSKNRLPESLTAQ